MPDRAPALAVPLLLLSLLLAAGLWFAGLPALACAWLAPVPATLGVSLLRGHRSRDGLLADAGRLLLQWGGASLLACGLLAWPLARLLDTPTLGSTLLLSGTAGSLLVLLWWQWPAWHGLARLGGPAANRHPEQRALPRDAWRGLLQVALPVTALLCLALLLVWPDLLQGAPRLASLIAFALLLPLGQLSLQSASTITRVRGLPVVEMPTPAALPELVLEAAPAVAVAATASGPDVTALTRDLYAAARNGRVERALALLAEGADPAGLPESGARDRRSLSVLAAILPDLRLLRALVERGIDLNADLDGMTPLLAATRDSWHGRPEAVMTLLANGADPRLADAEGNTPLHHAARSSDPAVAALLLDKEADINALNREGWSPLGCACSYGNWRLARFLLERGGKPEPEAGRPALLCAASCEEDDPAGVHLLLRHKARATARDVAGRSALHEAAAAGHSEIARTLLAAHADVDVRDAAGRTPLHEAARAGSLPLLEHLLAATANPHATDTSGSNALHLACAAESPSLDVVTRLLALGVAADAENDAGQTPLALATAARHWALAAVLDPHGGPATSPPDEDEAPPARPPLLVLREALLEARPAAQLHALAQQLAPGNLDSLLADAELIADPASLHWLLHHGANPEARLPGQPTTMQRVLAQGAAAQAQLRLLLCHGGSPAGAGGLARFLAASFGPSTDNSAETCALDLLARGADPFGNSAPGEPPVLLATRLGWRRLLQQLLDLGADPAASDARGLSALHHAAHEGRLPEARMLIAAGASPDRRAADGLTPLGVALYSGRRDLAEWLEWRSWKLPGRRLRASDLPAAAVAGDLAALHRLLELGFPVDATDAQGCTALLRAAGGGHLALVDALLTRGANPSIAATSGATPLSAAISMRHTDIVERLLAAGCQLEQRLPGDVTVLMLAAALGQPELVTRLLQAGADLHAADAQGLTPLHCAALFGFTAEDRSRLIALLDGLLLAGANPAKPSANGTTPLLLLLGARADVGTPSNESILLAALERLLDEDEVRLDVRDPRGFSPLHLAALHGLQRVVQALLQFGADPGLQDNAGRLPRDIAQGRGYVDIAAALTPRAPSATGGVSMARFLRE